jgi:membrane protease YdiL (CAAX protease family)
MTTPAESKPSHTRPGPFLSAALVSVGLLAFCAAFLLVDQAYFQFASARFPAVGPSVWLATAWGIVSRAPWLLLLALVAIMRPRLLALNFGEIRPHWRLIVSVVAVNCGLVAAFLYLTGGNTPYSGNEWLITEVVTVPVIEELFWRGLVFSIVAALLRRSLGKPSALNLAAWLSGIAFGSLHAGNALAGVPLQFVAIQTLSAIVWGVLYGYLRARTESVFPAMLSHAAMNLVVILS